MTAHGRVEAAEKGRKKERKKERNTNGRHRRRYIIQRSFTIQYHSATFTCFSFFQFSSRFFCLCPELFFLSPFFLILGIHVVVVIIVL